MTIPWFGWQYQTKLTLLTVLLGSFLQVLQPVKVCLIAIQIWWQEHIYCFICCCCFFNWKITALENFVVFCQTSTWISHQFSSVQSFSRVWLFATPWITARQASLSITNSQSLLKPMSIKSVMPSHPLSSPSPPASNRYTYIPSLLKHLLFSGIILKKCLRGLPGIEGESLQTLNVVAAIQTAKQLPTLHTAPHTWSL